MKNLIAFELRKIVKSKKTWVVFALLLIVFLYYGIGDTIYEKNHPNCDLEVYELSYQNDQVKMTNESNNPLKLLKKCQNGNRPSDEFLNSDINYCKEKIKNCKTSSPIYKEYNNRISIDNYLLKTKLPYVSSFGNLNGMFSVASFTMNLPFFFGLIFVLLSADVFNKEYNTGTYKILLLQPFSKSKLVLSKFIASFISCAVAFLSTVLIYLIISIIAFGLLPLDYPTLVTENYLSLSMFSKADSQVILPLYLYFILSLLMVLVFALAICAICLMLSLVIKSKSITYITVSLTCICFSYLYYRAIMLAPANWNVFAYLNISNVLDGRFMSIYQQNVLTFLDSIVVPLIYSIAFVYLSLKIIKTKDFEY